MTKRLFVAFLVGVAGTLVLATVSSGGTSKKQATPLPASSCAPLVYKGAGTPKFIMASDLPRQGAQRSQSNQMMQAEQFILSGAGWKAGAYTVGFQDCDDSTAQAGKWDSAKCSQNANSYANDKDVIGVVGTFNSGCSEIIVPILNRAPGGSVGMVSPANTYTGLTTDRTRNRPGRAGQVLPDRQAELRPRRGPGRVPGRCRRDARKAARGQEHVHPERQGGLRSRRLLRTRATLPRP